MDNNNLTLKDGLMVGALVASVSAAAAFTVRYSTTDASLKQTEARIAALERLQELTEGGK